MHHTEHRQHPSKVSQVGKTGSITGRKDEGGVTCPRAANQRVAGRRPRCLEGRDTQDRDSPLTPAAQSPRLHHAKPSWCEPKIKKQLKKKNYQTVLQFQLVGENFTDLRQPGHLHFHCGSLEHTHRHTNAQQEVRLCGSVLYICVALCVGEPSGCSATWMT